MGSDCTFPYSHPNQTFALHHAIRAERLVQGRVVLPGPTHLVRRGRTDIGWKRLGEWLLSARTWSVREQGPDLESIAT